MKRTFKAFAAVMACALLGSCVTISRPVAATGNPVGSKCGVAKSTIILGIWSTKGDENGIAKAFQKELIAAAGNKGFVELVKPSIQSVQGAVLLSVKDLS